MLLLQQTVPAGFPAKLSISDARPGSGRNRLRCPKSRRRQIVSGRRTASRTKHYGHIGYRREGLVAIPEEVEGGTQTGLGYSGAIEQTTSITNTSSTATTTTIRCSEPGMAQLQEENIASKAKENTYHSHRNTSPPEAHKEIPPQAQQGEREHRPVTLRWESPQSTIQLEDLLFGIGSQFDDMPFPPRQLSHTYAACYQSSDDILLPPEPSLPSSITPTAGAAGGPNPSTPQPKDMTPANHPEDADDSDSDTYADEDTTLLVDKADVSSRPPLLPVASATPRPNPAPSYLRRLSGTLASTMRRACVGLWNLVKWKVCHGVRVHVHGNSSSSRRPWQQQQRQQGGLEKRGGRGGVIYLA